MSQISCNHNSHLARLSPPSPFSKIYKDECTYCFTSPEDENGLDVCLHCFNGSCLRENTSIGSHSQLHYVKTGHSLVLNIRKLLKGTQEDEDMQPAAKFSKIEVKAEKEPEYEFLFSLSCLSCDSVLPWKSSDEVSSVNGIFGVGLNAAKTIQAIINANSAQKQSEAQAWQEEVVECEHTRALKQDVLPQLSLKPRDHCSECESRENLWICLTCGNIGCGRRQYDGSGGNGHGAAHFDALHHPIAVKLGTITADGSADVHCYICKEMRVDPNLQFHLVNLGINTGEVEKTEKTMAELQLEQNLKFDFSMVSEDGKALEAISGPRHVGLRNLGNSCYLSAVVQSLFSLAAFSENYGLLGGFNHQADCSRDPTTCFACQASKLQMALESGVESAPAPWMFKSVSTSGHAGFMGTKQQDAAEFLSHLLKVIKRSDPQNAAQLLGPMTFSQQQSLKCLTCGDSKYQSAKHTSISLQVSQFLADTGDSVTLSEKIALFDCLKSYFADEVVEAMCSKCQGTGKVKSQKLISTPDILIIDIGRYILKNWVPQKVEIAIDAPFGGLDLTPFVTTEVSTCNAETPKEMEPELPCDELVLVEMVSMGFPQAKSKKAIQSTGNIGVEAAMNWMFENEDLVVPEESPNSAQQLIRPEIPEEKLQTLVDAGFARDAAASALTECEFDIERAFDWLLSRPSPVENDANLSPVAVGPSLDIGRKPVYTLRAFISHKGPSVDCGHYVAHVKDDKGRWILFNDDRVVVADSPQLAAEQAYICIYQREE